MTRQRPATHSFLRRSRTRRTAALAATSDSMLRSSRLATFQQQALSPLLAIQPPPASSFRFIHTLSPPSPSFAGTAVVRPPAPRPPRFLFCLLMLPEALFARVARSLARPPTSSLVRF
eukprot:6177413-Pleurochrysis_carterae.AAC.1